jgi:hypothetical protein
VKTVVNKTRSPLKVLLPQGKLLRLGPDSSGRIRDEDVEHAPVKKLIASGAIEIVAAGTETGGLGGAGSTGRGQGRPNVRQRESAR